MTWSRWTTRGVVAEADEGLEAGHGATLAHAVRTAAPDRRVGAPSPVAQVPDRRLALVAVPGPVPTEPTRAPRRVSTGSSRRPTSSPSSGCCACPLFVWLLFGAHQQTRRPPGCWPPSAPPTGSTATWPGASTRCRRSARCSTRSPTGCSSGRRSSRSSSTARCRSGSAWPPSPGRCWWPAMVLLLATLGARRIDVLWVGKAGTFGLMFAYPAFLLGPRDARAGRIRSVSSPG